MSKSSLPTRRRCLQLLTGLAVGGAAFHRALAAQMEKADTITAEMIAEAEWITGIELDEDERKEAARWVDGARNSINALRQVDVGYEVEPALHFNAAPFMPRASQPPRRTAKMIEAAAPARPQQDEDLAFLPVTELAALIRSQKVTSTELTRLYLRRLKQYDAALHCVVTLTEETALKQAAAADAEIAAGRYRGPLHGIPWGAKDLIAWPGYPTTWGATQFANQMVETKATVAARLEDAGAVLVAKLSLGALAWGDRWFGGLTRNPWNTKQGSSGSSAGSAAATAAGLVGFSLGSETLGSIISPSRRCGTTGLRPTFGRVSRHGCMSLAWSMDKIGPITRSVEDCALVLAAIHGEDGYDPTAVNQPFQWPPRGDIRQMTLGYLETETPAEKRKELLVLKELGATLRKVSLPRKYPAWAMSLILNVEAAAAFDPLSRSGDTDGLNRWPGALQQGQFTPAVEYLRANRVRTLAMREMNELFKDIDALVDPANDALPMTNLTGQPAAVIPYAFRRTKEAETPLGLTFVGPLFEESKLLMIARTYQQATGEHLKRPPMAQLTATPAAGD